MLPDDVFRDRLEQTLLNIEEWASAARDCAAIDIVASQKYWRMVVLPFFPLACPFEMMIRSDQKFSLKLATEIYEDQPLENFELFPDLVRAIEAGHVERIEKFNAMTSARVGVAMRVELAPDRHWIGERRLAPTSESEEWRTFRFLPLRR